MKFNVTVEFEEYDSIHEVERKIISTVANQLFNMLVCNNNNKKEFKDNMIDYVKVIMGDTINTPQFKKEVTEAVTQRLIKSYNQSKECKEIANSFDIKNDSEMARDLRNIISEAVGRELTKRFK